MKKLFPFMAALAMCGFMFASTAFARDYVFLMPLRASAKESDTSGGLQDKATTTLSKVCAILSKKTGENVTCLTMHMPNESLLTKKNADAFMKKINATKYSFIYLSSNDLYELERYGYDEVAPGLQISMFKKTYDVGCFYTRADDNISSVEQLRGKVWGGGYSYMDMKYLLLKNGIKEKPETFFKSLKYYDNDVWAEMAGPLVDKKIDVFNSASVHQVFGVGKDDRFREIDDALCVKLRNTHVIAFRNELPDKEKIAFTKILANAHKDKEFQPFWFIFSALQGHFVPFDKNSYETITKPYIDAVKGSGWEKDYISYAKKNGGM